jgi:hypothetical protein
LARVSKDDNTRGGLWPSFETRPSKSAVADFDTTGCRSQASLTSVGAPQDEVRGRLASRFVRPEPAVSYCCAVQASPGAGVAAARLTAAGLLRPDPPPSERRHPGTTPSWAAG